MAKKPSTFSSLPVMEQSAGEPNGCHHFQLAGGLGLRNDNFTIFCRGTSIPMINVVE